MKTRNINNTGTAHKFSPKNFFSLIRLRNVKQGSFSILIFFMIAIATFAGYMTTAISIDELRSNIISRRVEEYKVVMLHSAREYESLQLASVGRIESAVLTPIPESAWKQYISVYNPSKNFPSMKFIAVSFGNQPKENKVYFIDPYNDATKQKIGTDVASVLKSPEPLKSAATQDRTTVYHIPHTSQDHKGSDESASMDSFYLISPFYDRTQLQTRVDLEKSLRGFTVTAIDERALFSSILVQERLIQSRIRVYMESVSNDNLLHESDNREDKKAEVITIKQVVPFIDKKLTVVYDFDKSHILPWYATYFPVLLLIAGLSFALVLSISIGYLVRQRYADLSVEKERDIELAKDELLSLASHQLRTPATGVKQYLGMVLQGFSGKITPKQREYLERAYASNDRQLNVINDILHLAKLGSGRIVLAEREFDMTKLIRDIVEEHRSEILAAGLDITLSIPPRGVIYGDSHMLRMVFENLLSNAIKYTHEGGAIKITVLHRHDHWYIRFSDTGVGIGKDDLPKLFKQFSRIKNPRTDFVTGTGVGLYLAYHLTQLHGGWIKVSSQLGQGSTFSVCLPKKRRRNK